MERTFITNNFLMNKINEIGNYIVNDEEAPDDVFISFINELGVSNLLAPGIVDEESINFEVLTSDDESFNALPVFSDDDAFIDYYGEDSDFEAIANDIRFYIELIGESEIDGLVINPGNLEFYLEKEVLENLPLNPVIEIKDDFEGYNSDQLQNIAQNATNESLISFMNDDDNHFEALMLELQKATLLDAVVSEEDLSQHAENGIISLDETGTLPLCTTGDDDVQLGVLFTSPDKIRNAIEEDSELNYYYQIALLDDFIEFVLKSDMDGIIINPSEEDYVIGRDELLEAYGGLTYNNPSFKKAIDYAFIL